MDIFTLFDGLNYSSFVLCKCPSVVTETWWIVPIKMTLIWAEKAKKGQSTKKSVSLSKGRKLIKI